MEDRDRDIYYLPVHKINVSNISNNRERRAERGMLILAKDCENDDSMTCEISLSSKKQVVSGEGRVGIDRAPGQSGTWDIR